MRQFFNDSDWEVVGFAILKFFYYLPNFIFSAMLEVNWFGCGGGHVIFKGISYIL